MVNWVLETPKTQQQTTNASEWAEAKTFLWNVSYATVQRAALLWSEHSSGHSQLAGNADQERFKLRLNIADNRRLGDASVCSARLSSHQPVMKLAVQRDPEHHDWRTHCSNIKYLPSEARDLSQKHSSLSAARTASAWHLPPHRLLTHLVPNQAASLIPSFPRLPLMKWYK